MLPPYVSDEKIDAVIQIGLAEDEGNGDITTLATIDRRRKASAQFLAKAEGIAAGTYVVERVFRRVEPDIRMEWTIRDGSAVGPGTEIGTVSGAARSILTAERLALNLLQRMSGIASATHAMAAAIKPYPAKLLDTRKTAPGLRILDKWAVFMGGGQNHRLGLYDMFLIKDNHIEAAGSIADAIRSAVAFRDKNGIDARIEVEASTIDQVREILANPGVDIILLDNMVDIHADGTVSVERLSEAVELVDRRLLTEASGNVTIATVSAIAATGVDYISAGSLTHSVKALDISLLLFMS